MKTMKEAASSSAETATHASTSQMGQFILGLSREDGIPYEIRPVDDRLILVING
jgi:hypothetical protein